MQKDGLAVCRGPPVAAGVTQVLPCFRGGLGHYEAQRLSDRIQQKATFAHHGSLRLGQRKVQRGPAPRTGLCQQAFYAEGAELMEGRGPRDVAVGAQSRTAGRVSRLRLSVSDHLGSGAGSLVKKVRAMVAAALGHV